MNETSNDFTRFGSIESLEVEVSILPENNVTTNGFLLTKFVTYLGNIATSCNIFNSSIESKGKTRQTGQ